MISDPAMTSDAPTITVLMPVFNGQEFLIRQVESILSQDYDNLRLLLLDDSSTDGSLAIANDLASSDGRITVLRNNTNMGLIASIGRLLRAVRTPYFALADQDDVWDSCKISKSIRQLATGGAVLVYSDVRLIDTAERVLEPRYLSARRIRTYNGRDVVPFVFRNPAIGHTIVGVSEVATLAGSIPLYLTFHEAWIVANACTLGCVEYLDAPLGGYRVHDSNVVGPHAPSLFGRFRRGPSATLQVLKKRQQTRRATLQAISLVRPDLSRIAGMSRTTGLRRLLSVAPFAKFMWDYRVMLGRKSVLTEVLAFATETVLPILPDQSSPTA